MRAQDCVATALLDIGNVTVNAQDCDCKTVVMSVADHRPLVCDPVAGDDCGCTAGHVCARGVGDGGTAVVMVDATTEAVLALVLMAGTLVERCHATRLCAEVVLTSAHRGATVLGNVGSTAYSWSETPSGKPPAPTYVCADERCVRVAAVAPLTLPSLLRRRSSCRAACRAMSGQRTRSSPRRSSSCDRRQTASIH
jgi:hypothetical protein